MKKNISMGVLVIGIITSLILMYYKLYSFMIIDITITILVAIYFFKELLKKETPESIYENQLIEIIKTYEPLLVEVEVIPDFDVKNIIIVQSFEKIVDIQYELKKPILFHKTHDASSFIIMDDEISYVCTLKINENSFSPVEKVIDELEKEKKKRKNDKKLLEDLEKTTIIKLDNMKEYKVSPIRKIELNTEEEFVIQIDELDNSITKKEGNEFNKNVTNKSSEDNKSNKKRKKNSKKNSKKTD